MARNPQRPRQTPGETLRRHRETAGLSVRQLASQIDVAPSQVTRWERGDQQPSPASLLRLAQTLELPAVELFAEVGVPLPAEALSLPAMLRREYDVPPEAIAEMQREVERVAHKYQERKAKPTNKKGG